MPVPHEVFCGSEMFVFLSLLVREERTWAVAI